MNTIRRFIASLSRASANTNYMFVRQASPYIQSSPCSQYIYTIQDSYHLSLFEYHYSKDLIGYDAIRPVRILNYLYLI